MLESLWDEVLLDARDEDESARNRRLPALSLSWEEVLDVAYTVQMTHGSPRGKKTGERAS